MSQLIEIKVPDIGDFHDVPVIEIFVQPGAIVELNDSLMTLESDKATVDVPSPAAGVIKELRVSIGDKVSQGTLIALLEGATASDEKPVTPEPPVAATAEVAPAETPAVVPAPAAAPAVLPEALPEVLHTGSAVHASPSVRAYARELGVVLDRVKASGKNGRILREDVTAFVKGTMTATPAATVSNALPPAPKVDFSKYGATEVRPLSRIQRISAQNLARNWATIPAVTFHEDADITELEAFRVQLNKENAQGGAPKLTLLAFLIKACVKALQLYPTLNSSLDGEGETLQLILKKYYHIGFAADTPNGLMVPVIKNADQKSVYQIAEESAALAQQARAGSLKIGDMQGACFTISSLGGIGGTGFAPIVNAPEVAILGVSRAAMKPVWDGTAFVPRLIAPLSLTADHRVVDGALATRFTAVIAQMLGDFRRVSL